MKIFIHTMYYFPESGSAPILMQELSSFLSSKGHDVEVVTTIPRPPYHKEFRKYIYKKEHSKGFTVKRFRTNFSCHPVGRLIAWSFYTGWSLLNLFKATKDDVLFLRLPPLQLGVVGFIAGKFKRGKILISVQDIHPDLSIESGLLRNPWLIKLAERFEKWVYKNSDKIVVISDGFQKNLENKGVDPDKLNIIPNWVDTDIFRPYPKKNPVSQRLSLDDKFVVMYSGTITLNSYVSLGRVLEAALLLKDDNNVIFVIIGEGLKKFDLVRKAHSLGVENVKFLPFLPYEDVPYTLSAGDVLLVPLDKEKTHLSVPSKLYSYISTGRPILALADRTSEVARIVEEAECGLRADPDDPHQIAESLSRLKNSASDRNKYGINSRKYCIDNYSKERVLQIYENVIMGLGERWSKEAGREKK
jgi:colanic acid biosynthesis glycosyl transferase WcaI